MSKQSNIYSTAVLTRKIHLYLDEVGKNLEDNLLQKLKENLEGKCNIDGYIKPNSIKLLTYSSGLVNSNDITFEVGFECDLCLPSDNSIIEAVVKNITKAGIRAEIVKENEPTPLVIFITRDYNYTAKDVNVGDKILANILGTRFELNDKYISVIAELVNDDEQADEQEDNESKKEEDGESKKDDGESKKEDGESSSDSDED